MPGEEFTKACIAFQEAIQKAEGAAGGGIVRVQQSLAEIRETQQMVDAAVSAIDADKVDTLTETLNRADESLNLAQKQADSWEAATTEYEPLAEAKSLEVYGEEIGLPETDAI